MSRDIELKKLMYWFLSLDYDKNNELTGISLETQARVDLSNSHEDVILYMKELVPAKPINYLESRNGDFFSIWSARELEHTYTGLPPFSSLLKLDLLLLASGMGGDFFMVHKSQGNVLKVPHACVQDEDRIGWGSETRPLMLQSIYEISLDSYESLFELLLSVKLHYERVLKMNVWEYIEGNVVAEFKRALAIGVSPDHERKDGVSIKEYVEQRGNESMKAVLHDFV